MAAEEPPKKRGRGRPRVLTDAERKTKDRMYRNLVRRTVVPLMSAHERWQALRGTSGWAHHELASHLMEVHQTFCSCPGLIKLTENQQKGEKLDGVQTSVLQEDCTAKGVTLISSVIIADAYTQTEETSFEQIADVPGRRKSLQKRAKRSAKGRNSKPQSTETTSNG